MAGLKNKVVIVTGASGGIGSATAVEFARVGSQLCITGRNKEKLTETRKKCIEIGLTPEKILMVKADLTKREDTKEIVERTVEKFKRIDVLVNNAGAGIPGEMMETDMDVFDEMLAVNLKSVFQLSKDCLPHIIQTKGNIVNHVGLSGCVPMPGDVAYSTAKAAANHLTQIMALELGPKGVRVNSVNAGSTLTGFFNQPGYEPAPHLAEQYFADLGDKNPLKRMCKSEEVAKTIVFLASDDASFITGSKVMVDGGRHATTWGL